jgi:hypothetical protein
LPLKFSANIEPFGKVDFVTILHLGAWNDRMLLETGEVLYQGYNVKHPQNAQITLYRMKQGAFDIDHATPVPTFWLKEASNDFSRPQNLAGDMLTIPDHGTSVLQERNVTIEKELAHTKNLEMNYHQKMIEYEAVVEKQRVEIQGLLKRKGSEKKMALEYMLTIREMHLRIENGIKALKGGMFKLDKWTAIALAGVAIFALFIFNKDASAGLQRFLIEPTNQLFVGVIAILAVILIVFMARKQG